MQGELRSCGRVDNGEKWNNELSGNDIEASNDKEIMESVEVYSGKLCNFENLCGRFCSLYFYGKDKKTGTDRIRDR